MNGEGDSRAAIFSVSREAGGWQFSRRGFLLTAGAAAAWAALACGSEAPEPTFTPLPTIALTDTPVPPTATPAPTRTPVPTHTPAPELSQEAFSANERLNACEGLIEHSDRIAGLFVTPGGDALITLGHYDKIKVWDLPTGALISVNDTPEQRITAACISPDSSLIAAAYESEKILLWDLPPGEKLPLYREAVDMGYRITSLAITPDNSLLITGSDYGFAGYRLPDLENVYTDFMARNPIIRISHDGSLLAVSSDLGGPLTLWRLPDFTLIAEAEYSRDDHFHDMIFTADDSALIAGIGEGIYVYRTASLTVDHVLDQGPYPAEAMAISPDGSLLATVRGGGINLWALRGPTYQRTLTREILPDVDSMVFTPDNQSLISTGWYGYIYLWSLADGLFQSCLVDIDEVDSSRTVIQAEVSLPSGETGMITLAEGIPLPSGSVCTCNTVAGGFCACVGHTSSGGGHYWYPN